MLLPWTQTNGLFLHGNFLGEPLNRNLAPGNCHPPGTNRSPSSLAEQGKIVRLSSRRNPACRLPCAKVFLSEFASSPARAPAPLSCSRPVDGVALLNGRLGLAGSTGRAKHDKTQQKTGFVMLLPARFLLAPGLHQTRLSAKGTELRARESNSSALLPAKTLTGVLQEASLCQNSLIRTALLELITRQ